MAESDNQTDIQIRVSGLGSRMFRINSAVGWVGSKLIHKGRDLLIKNARPLKAPPAGYHDLTGWTPVIITQAMVGKQIAIFTSFEVKTGKKGSKATADQKNFGDQVREAGGITGVCHTADQAEALILQARQSGPGVKP